MSYRLDGLPLLVRNSVIEFLGKGQDRSLRLTCTVFARAELSIDEVVHLVSGEDEISPSNNYRKFEKIVRQIKETRKQDPSYFQGKFSYEALGGLDFLMDSNEIATYVQKKFDELRKSGILLYRSEFESRENPRKFRSPGKERVCQALDRLWGAEYLRDKLRGREGYKVPRFYIVLKDNIKILPIKLSSGNHISITSMETPDAELLVENISLGVPVASDFCHRWLTTLGYVDYSDPGNILRGNDGNYYVVDTEWNSLEGCKDLNPEKIKVSKFLDYIRIRFNTFNPSSQIIKVELHK